MKVLIQLLVDLSNIEGQLYEKKKQIRAALRRLNITNAGDIMKREIIESKMIDSAANLQAIKILMGELSEHPMTAFEPTVGEYKANNVVV
jgi:hypothetical protein